MFIIYIYKAWMWEMYFWNVVTVFCITLCLAAFFVPISQPARLRKGGRH